MRGWLVPLRPTPPRRRIVLGVSFFVAFVCLWAAATLSGLVKPLFLADPLKTLRAGIELFASYGFIGDVAITVSRVLGGFIVAAVLAVPLGIAMGAWKSVEAFFEPFVSFARYLPASAFIPLTILWLGVGELQKWSIILIGSYFQIVIMVAVIVGATRIDLVEAAYTLGADKAGIVARVLLPAAAPQIAECLRLVLGWAWTYIIVAELVGSSSGIGHMITDAQRLLDTGQMIFGIVMIGLIGLVSDFAFKLLNRRVFRWYAVA